ncbi:MAG: aldo/keto reductase [Desulfobacterales bacterium]|nr:aldo/keto reductase [Desulfobacterales bacterium]
MDEIIHVWSRRDFLKKAGTAGAVSMLLPSIAAGDNSLRSTSPPASPLPVRPFGKTGVDVSILALGGSFDTEQGQLLLRQALNLGVTYWETAEGYRNGRSEKGMGNYFKKYPGDRQKVFLSTKTASRRPAEMTIALEESLQRLNTSYVDLYLWHRIDSLESLYDRSVRDWVEKMKGEGKIRLFGFSTHQDIEASMLAAARLGGIDGIQMSYNFRTMHTDMMKKAVTACADAGIGLTAMKTVANESRDRFQGAPRMTEAEIEQLTQLTGQFLNKGFTDIQARLVAVWHNPHITSICSYMPSMTVLESNVSAALNANKLSRNDMNILKQYARATASGYCTGCAAVCTSAVGGAVPVHDVMRYLMYYHGYGEQDSARALFRELSPETRTRMIRADYSRAEQRCPQKMAIGSHMQEAARILA